jgi:uncharacterized membrane protein HdeD (DUF308 family)
MQLILLSWYRYTPSTTTYHDPADTWAALFLLFGTIALILGLTNWRLGIWFQEYNVRLLNILSGIAGIIIGLILIYG